MYKIRKAKVKERKFNNGSREFNYNFGSILAGEKEEIEKDLKRLKLRAGLRRDFWERAKEVEEEEEFYRLCLTHFEKIKTALKKWEEGNYGNCSMCGKQMPEERLLITPETTHCIACQRCAE